MAIHSTAIIEPGAQIPDTCDVGPFCWVGPNVVLGENVRLVSHVTISGHTTIGEGTLIYPFASLGHPPQDLKYAGEPSELRIGSHNVIREHVTMQPGTEGGGMLTSVGSHGLFMVGIHVAHDCKIGDHVIMANNATLAGHVHVGDYAVIGGLVAVHQFVRIGHNAMIGGMCGVERDVIPYGLAMGDRAYLAGLNLVGMKRRGIDREDINGLRGAFKEMFEGEGTLEERLTRIIADTPTNPTLQSVLSFIQDGNNRPLCSPKGNH